jgi:hypothetical protein
VISVGSPLAWIAPTLIGSPLITLAIRRPQVRRPATRGLDGPRATRA